MNIFVFGESSWDDKNSFGNTVSNFFCGKAWKEDKFFNFYVRNQVPDNNMEISYYQLSAIDILKGVAKLKIRGKQFNSSQLSNLQVIDKESQTVEQNRIDRLHSGKHNFIYFVHEMIWKSKIWLNEDFKNYIGEMQSDILFAFATSPYILKFLIGYLKKHTNCRVVLLITDDVIDTFEKTVWYRRNYLKKDLAYCIQNSDLLYGISDELSYKYSKEYGSIIQTLYKGCDLSLPIQPKANDPLKLVYAGNLLWGRADTLSEIAKSLGKINQDTIKAVLEIYTTAIITPDLNAKLNLGESSKIMGSRSNQEIKEILRNADIVLHVESFEKENIDKVKYSFSTKIIDCFQSGAQIIAIGPDNIASIEYLKKTDGAIVITKMDEIAHFIQKIVNEPDLIQSNIGKTRAFAIEKHEISKVQEKLRYQFLYCQS